MPRRERRAQLLDSALEVFVASGYHSAAMDDIAERAGVSKPVLYQHFPGKLDLYLALLDSSCDTIIDNCRQALASTHDNKQRVAATMSAFYEYVANDTGVFSLGWKCVWTHESRRQNDLVMMIGLVLSRMIVEWRDAYSCLTSSYIVDV